MNARLTPVQLNYLRNLTAEEYWVSVWGGLIIRDFDKDTGYLKSFRTIKEYESRSKTDDFWIYLNLRIFSDDNGGQYPIFICPKCPEMAAVPSLTAQQSQRRLEALRCSHSIISQQLCKDNWRQLWQIPNTGICILCRYLLALRRLLQHFLGLHLIIFIFQEILTTLT